MHFSPRNTPRALTAMMRSNDATSTSSSGLRGSAIPALRIPISSRPCASSASAIACAIDCSSDTSHSWILAFLPIRSAISRTPSRLRSARATRAPPSFNWRAMAAPISPAAPVISATFPATFMIVAFQILGLDHALLRAAVQGGGPACLSGPMRPHACLASCPTSIQSSIRYCFGKLKNASSLSCGPL